MDKRVVDAAAAALGPYNDRILSGISKEQCDWFEVYIRDTWKSAQLSFPEGLVFENMSRVNPYDEFAVATKIKEGKRSYEMSRSDLYMVRYDFSLNSKPLIPKYQYFPYLSDGAIMYLKSNKFAVNPVAVDPSFSYGADSMFIQLNRVRYTFERTSYNLAVDGQSRHVYLVKCWLHLRAGKERKRRAEAYKIPHSIIGVYLLIRYGLRGALAKFVGDHVVTHVGYNLRREVYPEDTWTIINSCGFTPRVYKNRPYKKSDLCVAIPKDCLTDEALAILGSFIYAVDHFPNDIEPEYVDDPHAWKLILGKIIKDEDMHIGAMINDIDDHLLAIEEYLDPMIRVSLKSSNIHCDDIYELLMYIMVDLSNRAITNYADYASMWDKRLTTLKYLAYDIVAGINDLIFQLKKHQKRKGELTAQDVEKILNDKIRLMAIVRIADKQRHPEVTPLASASECLYFNVTSNIVSQDRASRRRKASINLNDPKQHLDASLLAIGSYANLPKSDPTGASKLNPMQELVDYPYGDVGFKRPEGRDLEILSDLQARIMKR